MLAPRAVNVPERIGITRAPVENTNARTRQQAVRETAAPLDHRVLRRIVEHVLRGQIHECRLCAMDRGVANRHALRRREPRVDRRFHAGESQAVDVGGAKDVAGRAAHEVDAVALAPVEQSDIGPHARGRIPLQAGFITPRPLRPQVRAADVGGIVIVQVGISR